MMRPKPRAPTVRGGMLLIAALAVGLAPAAGPLGRHAWDYLSTVGIGFPRVPYLLRRKVVLSSGLLASLAAALNHAALLLRLRRGRPPVRGPGEVACLASSIFAALISLDVLIWSFIPPPPPPGNMIGLDLTPWEEDVLMLSAILAAGAGLTVLGSWQGLWIIGSWRPAPDWVDRARMALGIWWIASIAPVAWMLWDLIPGAFWDLIPGAFW